MSVEKFLAKNRTPVLQHHPWLFPKLRSALKTTHFELVETVKTKSTVVLRRHCEKRISDIVSSNGKYGWNDVLNVTGSMYKRRKMSNYYKL